MFLVNSNFQGLPIVVMRWFHCGAALWGWFSSGWNVGFVDDHTGVPSNVACVDLAHNTIAA